MTTARMDLSYNPDMKWYIMSQESQNQNSIQKVTDWTQIHIYLKYIGFRYIRKISIWLPWQLQRSTSHNFMQKTTRVKARSRNRIYLYTEKWQFGYCHNHIDGQWWVATQHLLCMYTCMYPPKIKTEFGKLLEQWPRNTPIQTDRQMDGQKDKISICSAYLWWGHMKKKCKNRRIIKLLLFYITYL